MNFIMNDNLNSDFLLNDFGNPEKFHDDISVSEFPLDYYINALKRMKLIRRSEEILGDNVENGKIKCPCHLSIGQEAIPVGVAQFLSSKDFVFGNHRSHGHYLSMTDDVHKLFAETLGKKTGSSKGMGGSMHVIARDDGFHGSVPIVSATIPVAVGAALSSKIKNLDSISVSYFGDGTTEEGVFHESLNLASFYQLPILFVCENNLFSSHMHINERQPLDSVARFALSHNVNHEIIDGNDITSVFKTAQKAINQIRNGSGPFLIETITYRWRGHVGPDENIDVGLKRKDDLNLWKKRDPIARLESSLINSGSIASDNLKEINLEINEQTRTAWDKAENDPYPEPSQLLDTVYYD